MTVTPLPPLVLVTDRFLAAPRSLVDVARAAVAGGVRAVLLRDKDLPAAERAATARALAEIVEPVGGVLVTASTALGGAGAVHLAASDAMPTSVAGPIVGRSCHDERSLQRAAAEGCAYATLSPIFPSASKPGYGPPLGPAALAAAPLPVYALAGVDASNAAACLDAGAAGVFVMSAVMAAADPAAAAAAVVDAVGSGR